MDGGLIIYLSGNSFCNSLLSPLRNTHCCTNCPMLLPSTTTHPSFVRARSQAQYPIRGKVADRSFASFMASSQRGMVKPMILSPESGCSV